MRSHTRNHWIEESPEDGMTPKGLHIDRLSVSSFNGASLVGHYDCTIQCPKFAKQSKLIFKQCIWLHFQIICSVCFSSTFRYLFR